MDIKTKNNALLFSVIVIAVAVGVLVYLGAFKNSKNLSYYSPDNKIVSFDKKLPADFPEGIILEGKELDYSGAVYTVTNKVQTGVSYFSDKTLPDLVTMYENNFTQNGWEISGKKVTDYFIAFDAEKRNQKVHFVVMLTHLKGKVRVEFSYEK